MQPEIQRLENTQCTQPQTKHSQKTDNTLSHKIPRTYKESILGKLITY